MQAILCFVEELQPGGSYNKRKKRKDREPDMERFDVLVAGGGFAGAAAAIAAARQGARVILVEQYNCLGGAACNALVNPFMPYGTHMPETGEWRALCNGIFAQVLAGLREMDALGNDGQTFDEEALKLLLNRMAIQAGVRLLFHAQIAQVQAENGEIKSVLCSTPGGMITLEADTYIDATGDGTLSMLAGCAFQLGRERDHLCQPMTLCFRMDQVDKEQFRQHRAEINPLYQQFQKEGKIKNIREDVLIFDTLHNGVLHFNSTRIVRRNPTDAFDLTQAEIDAREQVDELWRFLRDNIPGFEHSRVLSTALRIGARESRMIAGEYCLTQEDLKACTKFSDGIAAGNYDIDIHNPEGSGTSHYYFAPGTWYTIPYRCLLPKDIKNLLVAGRCISSTHEAQASYRIMPIVCCIGEAAGTAAGVAHQAGVSLRDVDIAKVRTLLQAGGAPI